MVTTGPDLYFDGLYLRFFCEPRMLFCFWLRDEVEPEKPFLPIPVLPYLVVSAIAKGP